MDDQLIALQHKQHLSNHPHSEQSKAPLRQRYPSPTPLLDVSDLVYLHYFGGARSKGFATLRNVSKLTFLGQDWACKVCRFSVYLEITSISSIYSLTYWRKKESRGLNQLTCVTRQIRGDSKLRD